MTTLKELQNLQAKYKAEYLQAIDVIQGQIIMLRKETPTVAVNDALGDAMNALALAKKEIQRLWL